MKIKPATPEAVQLFQRGVFALSKMEQEGILIDVPYLEKQIDCTTQEIKRLEQLLRADKIFDIWRKRFGYKTNLGAHAQLEKVIFDELGHNRSGKMTKSGDYSGDQEAFEFVKIPFVDRWFECEKLKKARGTYLLGIQRELCEDNRIRPIFDLHTAVTFRSSASRPNFQNVPVRNPEISKIIRRCVIAPKRYVVVEVDLSGAEVVWSACHHRDPNMVKYIEDPTTDMHRDVAVQLFKCKKNAINKMSRYVAKNMFTFPQFYGSYWVDCARNIWKSMELLKLTCDYKNPSNMKGINKEYPMRDWMKRKGITQLGSCDSSKEPAPGTFAHHVREIERDFWNNRFQVYKQWKWDWWNEYCEKGWFPFLTGFVGSGLMDRKQVCNSPIQGAAFHHPLWSLIQIQNEMERKRMRSKAIAEIHDSIVFYAHIKEIDDVLYLSKRVMTQDARKHWPCICVPVTVEAEASEEGASWYEKKPRKIA